MNELALFAGAGGGILGGHLLGWRTVCAVECDAYAAQVLAARQNDRTLRPFPIWSDVCSFDGKPWRGIVDVVSGGFPCQDISVAGKGTGLSGARSGLWNEMARIVAEVRPRFVFVENSPILTSRGLGTVLGDLAQMGFDAKWGVISAADTGARHLRERIWIVAHAHGNRLWKREIKYQPGKLESTTDPCTDGAKRTLADCLRPGLPIPRKKSDGKDGRKTGRGFAASREWPSESGLDRVANGVAHRVDRIKALGNGQVPRVAATAFTILDKDYPE